MFNERIIALINEEFNVRYVIKQFFIINVNIVLSIADFLFLCYNPLTIKPQKIVNSNPSHKS